MNSALYLIVFGLSGGIACCAACVLLAILWMLSFLTSALFLPSYSYPENCSDVFHLDQNTVEWVGISSEQVSFSIFLRVSSFSPKNHVKRCLFTKVLPFLQMKSINLLFIIFNIVSF